MTTSAEDFQNAWNKVFDIIIDAGAYDEFVAAVRLSAECASRIATAVYDDERKHVKNCVRAEFCYELADGAKGALEASKTHARIEEAERIRQELADS